MAKNSDKTQKKHEAAGGEWHFIDAKGKVLGRIATEASMLLLGKHRTDAVKNLVSPVFVVITNTDEVVLTGRKEQDKVYRHHTGWPGGLKTRSVAEQRRRDSRVIVEQAVFGMLPKNTLRPRRMKHLKLYPGSEHPHEAQAGKKISK